MESFIKIGLGIGLAFLFMSFYDRSEIKLETQYIEKECPALKPEKQLRSPNLEVAFQTCNEFLESYMRTVDKLQDEVKWLNNQIINCNDEIRFYRNSNESESYSN